MRAGRLLSLSFSILFVAAVFFVARRVTQDSSMAWIAAFLTGASPLVTEQISAGTSDIPSAALLWTGVLFMLVARGGRHWFWPLTGILWALAALGKVTALGVAAGFTVISIVWGIRQRWSWKVWAWMTTGLAVPAYAVYGYWNAVRPPFPWWYFLWGWSGPYYASLGSSSRLSNLLNPRWFGVFLTLFFVIALVAAVGRRFPRATSIVVAGVALLVARTRWMMAPGFRDWGNARLDDLVAGLPTIFVVGALALVLIPRETLQLGRLEREVLFVAAAYFAVWTWKLSYDARFLVGILPAVAIVGGKWLVLAARSSRASGSASMAAATALALISVTWEGARKMDRGYPAFSSAIRDINRQHGLRPEAKLEAIFGDSMRIVTKVQQILARDPSLRVISPDTRLAFYFGARIDTVYPTAGNIGDYDLLVWVNNPGIIGQYRTNYGIDAPFEALKSTGRLTELDKTPEYELYRIRRD